MSTPAIFIDKDGTLIHNVPYNVQPSLVRFMPGALEGLLELERAGYRLIVTTNQSGVARGHFTEDQIVALGRYLTQELRTRGIALTAFYFCPHLPEGSVEAYATSCECRKPKPGLILEAARAHDLDLRRSWVIGDSSSDIKAGQLAGCRTALIRDQSQTLAHDDAGPDVIARDIAEAALAILAAQPRHDRFEAAID